MTGLLTTPVAPEPVRVSSIADEVEAWLRTVVQPAQPVWWLPRGDAPVAVRGREDLAELLARLDKVGEWGVAKRPHTAMWGQSMRVRDGWIVEVCGIPGPDCFARRVRAVGSRSAGRAKPRAGRLGRPTVTYQKGESIGSASEAADVLWSWLCGRLPDGYELRDVVEGVD